MNNKIQLNVTKNFSKNTEMPYSETTNVIYHDGMSLMSETLNNTYQQLLDNDKFIELNLNYISHTVVGPKSSDSQIYLKPNGYKFWTGLDDGTDVNILLKVDVPILNTVVQNANLRTSSINFIIYHDNKFYVAADTGLYSSVAMKDFTTVIATGIYAYLIVNSTLYVCGTNGVYKYKSDSHTFELILALANCRSIALSNDKMKLHIGTTLGIYVVDYVDLGKVTPTRVQLYTNGVITNTQVNDIKQIDDLTYLATTSGLFNNTRQVECVNLHALSNATLQSAVKTLVVTIPYTTYVAATNGLYELKTDIVDVLKVTKLTDLKICHIECLNDLMFFSTPTGIYNDASQQMISTTSNVKKFKILHIEDLIVLLFLESNTLKYAFMSNTNNVYILNNGVLDFELNDLNMLYVVLESSIKRYQIYNVGNSDPSELFILTEYDGMFGQDNMKILLIFPTSTLNRYIIVTEQNIFDVDISDKNGILNIFRPDFGCIYKVVLLTHSTWKYAICTTHKLILTKTLTKDEIDANVLNDNTRINNKNIVDAVTYDSNKLAILIGNKKFDSDDAFIDYNLEIWLIDDIGIADKLDADQMTTTDSYLYSIHDCLFTGSNLICQESDLTPNLLHRIGIRPKTTKISDFGIIGVAPFNLEQTSDDDDDDLEDLIESDEVELHLSKCEIFTYAKSGISAYNYIGLDYNHHSPGSAVPEFQVSSVSQKLTHNAKTHGSKLYACTDNGLDVYELVDNNELVQISNLTALTYLEDLAIYDCAFSEDNTITSLATDDGLYSNAIISAYMSISTDIERLDELDDYISYMSLDNTLSIANKDDQTIAFVKDGVSSLKFITLIYDKIVYIDNSKTYVISFDDETSQTELDIDLIDITYDDLNVIGLTTDGSIVTIDLETMSFKVKINSQDTAYSYDHIYTNQQYVIVLRHNDDDIQFEVFSNDVLEFTEPHSANQNIKFEFTETLIIQIIVAYYTALGHTIADIETIDYAMSNLQNLIVVATYSLDDSETQTHLVEFAINEIEDEETGEIVLQLTCNNITDYAYSLATSSRMNRNVFILCENDDCYELIDIYNLSSIVLESYEHTPEYILTSGQVYNDDNSLYAIKHIETGYLKIESALDEDDENYDDNFESITHIAYYNSQLVCSASDKLYIYDKENNIRQYPNYTPLGDIVKIDGGDGLVIYTLTKCIALIADGTFNITTLCDDIVAINYITEQLTIDDAIEVHPTEEKTDILTFNDDIIPYMLLDMEHNHYALNNIIIVGEDGIYTNTGKLVPYVQSTIDNITQIFLTATKTYMLIVDSESSQLNILKSDFTYELFYQFNFQVGKMLFNTNDAFYVLIGFNDNATWKRLLNNTLFDISQDKYNNFNRCSIIVSDLTNTIMTTIDANGHLSKLYYFLSDSVKNLVIEQTYPTISHLIGINRIELMSNGINAIMTNDKAAYVITKTECYEMTYLDIYEIHDLVTSVCFIFNEHNRVEYPILCTNSNYYRIVNDLLEKLPNSLVQTHAQQIILTLFGYVVLGSSSLYVFDDIQESDAFVKIYQDVNANLIKFVDLNSRHYVMSKSSGTYELTDNDLSIASTLNITAYHKYSNSEFICNNGNKIIRLNNDITKCTNIFSISNSNVNCIYKKNDYEYYVGTTTGIYQTSNKYTTRKCMSKFGVSELYDLENQMLSAIKNYISRNITTHLNSMHNNSSLMKYINTNCVSTDFNIDYSLYSRSANSTETIVRDDIVLTFYTFDLSDGILDIQISNYTNEDVYSNVSHNGFIKQWKSGMTEMYVYIPTTYTYYLDHTDDNCKYANTTEIERQNTKCTTNSKIDTNYTHISVALNADIFNLTSIMTLDTNALSLPLKMYNDTKLLGTEDDTNAYGFHSRILPTIVRQLNKVGNTYVLEMACFGSDALAIRLMYDDTTNTIRYLTLTDILPNQSFTKKLVTIIYHSNNNANLTVTLTKMVTYSNSIIQLKDTLFENGVMSFLGWTTTPKSTRVVYQNLQQIDTKTIGTRLELYAIWKDAMHLRGTNINFTI